LNWPRVGLTTAISNDNDFVTLTVIAHKVNYGILSNERSGQRTKGATYDKPPESCVRCQLQ
jgi:hypothetical protein